MGSGPQRMTALTISTDQFRASDNPDKVYAGIASNSHKFIAEMRLVAEAMMAAGDKFLVGARTVDKNTGAVTQTFYVPEDKADLVVRNINVRRDTYRNKDYLDKHVYDLQNAEIVTGRDDAVLVERRYDFESANARRLGVRDIRAAGGIADKSKYRDLEHPYATAMYLPLDKAEYEARSGRSRSRWVRSQFNRALGHEASSERSFARAVKDRSEDERRRKESVKEAREEARDKQRKERESQREADRQAREDERTERINARAAASVQKAQERVFRQYQKEQEHRLKEQQKEQELRKREEARAESASNRERLSLFVRISAMLATVVALIRGISTSLLGAAGKAAGSVQSRLPNGFDVSTPVLDGVRSALSKLDLTGVFEPLVDAVTETVQKIRVQTLEGLQTGLTAAEVRLYDTNDVAHQLAAGTTVGAMKELTSSARDIIALAKDNNLGDDYAKMIMGSRLITELTDYSMGEGGYTTAGVFEDIIDAYFGQFKSGKNVLGQDVAPELLMQELTASIKSLMGANAATVLYNMMLNSLDGSYYFPYNNFEEWMYSTSTMQQIQEGAFAVPKEQLDYADVLSKSMSDTEAMLQAVFDKFLLGMQDWLASFLNAVDAVAYWFMSDADKYNIDEANRQKNNAESERLWSEASRAKTRAAVALGVSSATLEGSVKLSQDLGGKLTALPSYYKEGMNEEQIARYMEWVQLYTLASQADADAAAKGRVPYRSTIYTKEGQSAYKLAMLQEYLGYFKGGTGSKDKMRYAKTGVLGGEAVSSETAKLMLKYGGVKGASLDDMLYGIFNSASGVSEEDFANYTFNPYNFTDLIDEIMKNIMGDEKYKELMKGREHNDFTSAEIKSFFDSWWGASTPESRAADVVGALRSLISGQGNLSETSTVYGTYYDAYKFALAKQLDDEARNIMDFDLNSNVTSATRTESGAGSSGTIVPGYTPTTDLYKNAIAQFVKWLADKGAVYSRGSTQILSSGEGGVFDTGNRHGKVTFSGLQYEDANTVRIRFDAGEDFLKLLNDFGIKAQVKSKDAEGYIDFTSGTDTITVRGNN